MQLSSGRFWSARSSGSAVHVGTSCCLWGELVRNGLQKELCPCRTLQTGEPANLEMQIWGLPRSDDSCHRAAIQSDKRGSGLAGGRGRREAATFTILCWRDKRIFWAEEAGGNVRWISATQHKKCVSDGEINKAVSDHLKHCCAAGVSASFV